MKLLKINNNQGHFLLENGDYSAVDKVTTEDLLRLADLILSQNSIEFDAFDTESLANPAHQIIYKSLSDHFSSLRERKDQFLDESETIYLEAYERYRLDGEPEI